MTHLIVFVHGALSSHLSFAYIDQNLRAINPVSSRTEDEFIKRPFSYNVREEEADAIVDRLVQSVTSWRDKYKARKLSFIAHSYGGVLAVEAVRRLDLTKALPMPVNIVSMASPYGGSSAASFLKFLKPSSKMFKNIGRYDAFMRSFSAKPLTCRVRGLVTTGGGAEWIAEENDGVVSVGSQLHFEKDPLWSGTKLDFNHFEVLLSDRTVRLIEKELLRDVLA